MPWPFRQSHPVSGRVVRVSEVRCCKPSQLHAQLHGRTAAVWAAGNFTDIGLTGARDLDVPIRRRFRSVAGMCKAALGSEGGRFRSKGGRFGGEGGRLGSKGGRLGSKGGRLGGENEQLGGEDGPLGGESEQLGGENEQRGSEDGPLGGEGGRLVLLMSEHQFHAHRADGRLRAVVDDRRRFEVVVLRGWLPRSSS